MPLKVTSGSFRNGDVIPETHALGVPAAEGHVAMNGGNRNPDLRWSGEPAGTRSFVVLLVDGDVPTDMAAMNQEHQTIPTTAPRQDLAHWLVVDIPASVHEIPEGADSDGFTSRGKPVGQTAYGGITGAWRATSSTRAHTAATTDRSHRSTTSAHTTIASRSMR
jgi:phosphatidylethanolamine-binding protein (PEBP) family uncharacterized protein